MSNTEQSNERVPSMMQIINAVGRAAKVTSAMIMGNERTQHLIRARSAIFKIAEAHGYSLPEIMDYINHNRTVGYNYKSNLGGHLKRDAHFKAICAAAEQELMRVTPRVQKEPQTATQVQKTAIPDTPQEQKPKCPVFRAWKGVLGWSFTAEEIEREYYAKKAAVRFMKTYGQGRRPRPETTPTHDESVPEEMTTVDATLYLGVSAELLTRGVQLGYLHRFKVEGVRGYWYHTNELDRYREHINQPNK